jgi:predicted enzyme related to lactoylglutathione lyase
MATDEERAQRVNGITYLRIPAPDPKRSGDFYRTVFGWALRGDPDRHLTFSDSTGHVIGAFMSDLGVAGESGLLPYVFVRSVHDTLAKVTANGGEVVEEPYAEPPDAEDHLTVATFRDVAGNVIGLWQTGSAT